MTSGFPPFIGHDASFQGIVKDHVVAAVVADPDRQRRRR